MISFRLSAEELRFFQEACATRGVPNISELARRAIYQMLSSTASGEGRAPLDDRPLNQQFLKLSIRLHALLEDIDRLRSTMSPIGNGIEDPPRATGVGAQ